MPISGKTTVQALKTLMYLLKGVKEQEIAEVGKTSSEIQTVALGSWECLDVHKHWCGTSPHPAQGQGTQGLLQPHSQLWHKKAFLTTSEPWGLFNLLGSFKHREQRGTLTHQNEDTRAT